MEKNMAKYIVRDLFSMLRYLPWGIIVGIVLVMILKAINDGRKRKNKRPYPVWTNTCFIVYVVIMLFITFWSREEGLSKGVDLRVMSTWGINARNNAYVIENILLFIPYGFLCPWVLPFARRFISCTLVGFVTSCLIEYMQLFTGRGIWQIDDVLTNTIGASIGFLLYAFIPRRFKRK
jgi:glycopeptide antibiotics resistance protein